MQNADKRKARVMFNEASVISAEINQAAQASRLEPQERETTMIKRIDNLTEGDRINERFHQLVPGASHTYSKGDDQFPLRSPKIMVRAQGAYCWDADGNRYLDWAMGNRVIVLGHCYPFVNDAVKRQIDIGVNFTRPGILEYELAEYLVDLLPVAEMVKFGKNGSDVTSAAIKLARAYTGRKYVACCADHPFFSIGDWFIGTTPMSAGVPDEIANLTLRFPYNDIPAVERLLAQYPGQVAALLLEPLKNDEPDETYLQKLREITLREGVVLIFDEMISGVKFDIRGAHHLRGVYPDLACFGKAYANGYSFSLLAGKRDLMELGGLRHSKRRVFLLSQTHSSEAVGLAACRATLEECIRVDISSHIWPLGRKLIDGLRALAGAEGVADYVRIIGFDCNPQIVCTRSDGTPWPELSTSFHEELIASGILMPWITITYSHGQAELEQTFEGLQKAMRKVAGILATGKLRESFVGDPVKPVFRPFNGCLQSRCGKLHHDVKKLACCEESLRVDRTDLQAIGHGGRS